MILNPPLSDYVRMGLLSDPRGNDKARLHLVILGMLQLVLFNFVGFSTQLPPKFKVAKMEAI